MNFFDSKGQINASSYQDLIGQLAKYAEVMRAEPSNLALSTPSLSADEEDALMARAMYSPDGKLALAQTMANPIN